jgi:hypothetical protein
VSATTERLAESFLSHGLWPLATVIAVTILRRPLAELVRGLGGRITKVSVMSVSLELAEAREIRPTWTAQPGADLRGLSEAIMLNDSYAGTLLSSLAAPGTMDFMVVDLGAGDAWLTTRLFLFTALLERARGLRAVVFVHTRDHTSRMFLGISRPAEVQQALTAAYPWIADAWTASIWEQLPTSDVPAPEEPDQRPVKDRLRPTIAIEGYPGDALTGGQGHWLASELGQGFLRRVQSKTTPSPDAGWEPLPSSGTPTSTWEHASWLTTADLTDGALKRAVHPDACIIDQLGWNDQDRVNAVLAADMDYVAILSAHPAGRFTRLIDRAALAQKALAAAVTERT